MATINSVSQLEANVNTYIVVDTYAPTQTVVNFSPFFNGQVGDERKVASIWYQHNGIPWDLTADGGYTPVFDGVDPKADPIRVYGGQGITRPGDDPKYGRVSYLFPPEAFTTPGDYDSDKTAFALVDANGNQVTTNHVAIHVNQATGAHAIIDGKPYIDEFKKTKLAINQELDDMTDRFQIAQKYIDAIKAQISSGDIISKTDFNKFAAQLATDNAFTGSNSFSKMITALAGLKVTGDVNASGDVITNLGKLSDVFDLISKSKVHARDDITFSPAPETAVNNPFKAWDYPNGDGHGMIFMNTGFTYNNGNVGQPAWNNFNAGTINNLPKSLPYMVILPHFAIVSNGNIARVDVDTDGRLKVGSLAHTIEVGDTVEFSQMFLY